jgi:septum formation protein
MTTTLILASQSPFRRMLMENAGLTFEARPVEIAAELAIAKALDVSGRAPGAFVIGSDQTLSLDGRVFHKPRDLAEAKGHLTAMSGRTHALNCGVALVRDGETLWRHVSIARLTMRPLSSDFIDRYLARVGEKVLASVGAYQLEGEGVQLFDAIDGDYFTILGLPLLPLLSKLREFGVVDA